MNTRFSSWGGLFEMVTTGAMAFVKEAISPGESPLRNAMRGFSDAGSDCQETFMYAGEVVSLLMNVKVPSEVYYDQLAHSISEKI